MVGDVLKWSTKLFPSSKHWVNCGSRGIHPENTKSQKQHDTTAMHFIHSLSSSDSISQFSDKILLS